MSPVRLQQHRERWVNRCDLVFGWSPLSHHSPLQYASLELSIRARYTVSVALLDYLSVFYKEKI